MARQEKFNFKVLIRREPDAWVAHCLELDLVAVAPTVEQAESDIIDIVFTHVRYAFENDNIEHMYHPAPPEVWQEFFDCHDREETTYPVDSAGLDPAIKFVPIIEACKCFSRASCHT